MRYFLSYFVIVFYIFYLSLNVFINFPDTSLIVGEFYKEHQILQPFLYQKWCFFAPPPTSNKRAYLEFFVKKINGNTVIYKIELLKKNGAKVKKEYLTNDISANADWIMFNYIVSITDKYRVDFKNFQLINNFKNEDSIKKFNAEFLTNLENTKQMFFFIDQAKNLAIKMKIPMDSKFRLKICEEEIPKYSERYSKVVRLKEEVVIITHLYNLQNKKWTKLNF